MSMGQNRIISLIGRNIAPEDLREDGNIFNILRLMLASTVIFSHAYALLGIRLLDPTLRWMPFPISRLAVLLFFALSGFLVSQSLLRRGVLQFARARALRLVPGLWMMILVTSAVVFTGFSSTTGSPETLSSNPGLRDYLVRNLLLQPGGYFISGSFAANTVPDLVNGSLWTISREVQCYVVLALAGATGILQRRATMLVLWLAGIAAHLSLPLDIIPAITELRWLSIAFFTGVLMSLWRDHLRLSWPLAVAALLIAAMTDAPVWDQLTVIIAGSYALVTGGILAPVALKRFSSRMPDYSYGIYVYAFPAQQVAIALGLGLTPHTNMAAGFALALPFAIASWHFIEKPALAWKSPRRH